ncbi:hypothetical protein FACS1894153_0250 [Bacteroidia bacterium]|nr:hypothetical protein FACS1894153_0250 [Bacteroidia bacterium]
MKKIFKKKNAVETIVCYVISLTILITSSVDAVGGGIYYNKCILKINSSAEYLYYSFAKKESDMLKFSRYNSIDTVELNENTSVFFIGLDDEYNVVEPLHKEDYTIIKIEPVELDFVFDYGRDSAVASPNFFVVDLGSDYAKSPYLKFDKTGSTLMVCCPEGTKKLLYDYKFSNTNVADFGAFTVEVSDDGTNFEILNFFSEMKTTTAADSFILSENTKFIKFTYSLKNKGNIALGNIRIFH